ncbi:MAG: efflux RND transporter permease subunit [Candidatus Eiseniibacteriota bacterium]
MINALLQRSLTQRGLVLALAAALLVAGGWVAIRMPVDVFPDLNRPTVTVQTEAGSLAPEEVELLVTRPIEAAMNGAPGVERVRSASAAGLSIVTVEFGWNTHLLTDRQLVTERLGSVRETLPPGLEPTLGPVTSIMGEILLVGLESPSGKVTPVELRRFAEATLAPRLEAIPGVAQVLALGGGLREIRIEPDPGRLAAAGVTLEDVEHAAREATSTTSGGFLEAGSQEFVVRNLARTTNPDLLALVPVGTRAGVKVPLGAVADVRDAIAVRRGDAGVNGKPAVVITIKKQPARDTVRLTRAIRSALDDLGPSLPGDARITVLFEQARFIEASVRNVEEALRDGALLVCVILVLFLLNARTTAITLTAIPLSFAVAVLVLKAFGQSLNTMTLGGLAIATGEVVDDAIVGVENVFRRLRENRVAASPRPAFEVVYDASREVRNSIVYATLLVILVFLPLFALSGVEGRLFAPLGQAYVLAIAASFFVSLTVTPALCLVLLPKARAIRRERESPLVRALKAIDRRLLERTLARPAVPLVVAACLALAALATVPFLGREFLPPFNEGTATISVLARPGIALEESSHLGILTEQLIRTVPEVVGTGRRTGRAERDEHAEGVHYTEIDVDFRPSDRPREEVLADLRRRASTVPGVHVSVGQPISHRLDHVMSGVRAQIAVKVVGPDLAVLEERAQAVREAMAGVPGVVDLSVEAQTRVPQVQILADRDRLFAHGLSPGALNTQLEMALAGTKVGEIPDGQLRYGLVVRLPEEARTDVARLSTLLIDTPSGGRVPLGALADVRATYGPNQILRENGQRRLAVSCNVQGRDLGSVVRDVRAAVARDVTLPPGYRLELGGQFESQESATRSLTLLFGLALVLIYVVLLAHFRSHRIVLQVLLNLPIAMIGAVGAVVLTGGTFSVASLVGFIAVAGIASRNTILMVSHYLHLMAEEGEGFTKSMIVRGSLERLVPVLMTALTAGLALLPLVFAAGAPGKEILHPVATVIVGGLVSSTLLDIVVTPAAFWLFGRPAVSAAGVRSAVSVSSRDPEAPAPAGA